MLVKVVDENWIQGKFEILLSLEFEDQTNHPTLLWKFEEEWVKDILSLPFQIARLIMHYQKNKWD